MFRLGQSSVTRRITTLILSARLSSTTSSTVHSEGYTHSEKNAQMLEKAAMLRRKILEVWRSPEDPCLSHLTLYERQSELARKIIDDANLTLTTSREDDVTSALGGAFDRLLLMQVPLPEDGSTTHLRLMLDIAGKNGHEIPIPTVQHLFSRVRNYPEAISLFYAMRHARISMKVDAYYAMLFSLQRLEEESWCLRYREEAQELLAKQKEKDMKENGKLSHPEVVVPPFTEKSLEFILYGCENQLLPESKPWIGKVMLQDSDTSVQRRTTSEYDSLGNQWMRRLKNGDATLKRDDVGREDSVPPLYKGVAI